MIVLSALVSCDAPVVGNGFCYRVSADGGQHRIGHPVDLHSPEP